MEKFLSYTFLGNTTENYLWLTGIIFIAFLFKRVISKRISRIFYGIFKKFLKEAESIDKFFELLLKPIEYLIFFTALSFALNFITFPTTLQDEVSIEKIAYTIIQIIFVILFTWAILRLIDFMAFVLLKRAEKTESKTDDQIIGFIRETLKIVAIIFSLLFVLGAVFEFNIASLIAGLGLGGLAIALAAQDTIENLIASFIIFLDKPFIMGDIIKSGDIAGTVEKIGFRSTRIRTFDKSFLTIPNKNLIKDNLDNLTLSTHRRAKYYVSLTYNTSKEKLTAIIKNIQDFLDQHPKTDKKGMVKFESFGDSSLNILVIYFVNSSEYVNFLNVQQEINFKIMDIVKEHGCDFAFPTRTIHVVKE